MLQEWAVVAVAFAYLGLLFAIAYWADRRADAAAASSRTRTSTRSRSRSTRPPGPSTGSVGRAASSGVGFLPIYIGPTLVAVLWWIGAAEDHPHQQGPPDHLARRLHRQSGTGRARALAGLVTVIAVSGSSRTSRSSSRRSRPGSRSSRRTTIGSGVSALAGAPLFADSAFSIAIAARRLHHHLRDAPPRRLGAPRGDGRRRSPSSRS